MRTIRVALIAVVLVAAYSPGRLVAQEKPTIQQKIDQGLDLAADGRFQEATGVWLDVLGDGDASRPQLTEVKLYLGLAYKNLKEYPEAWHHLTEYLKKKSDTKAAGDLRKVEKALKETGFEKVSIKCEPERSRITFGPGERDYSCPLFWWFKPGRAQLTAVSTGCGEKAVELDVARKDGKGVHIVKFDGVLVIGGNCKGQPVFVGGKKIGRIPVAAKLPPGTYDVSVGPQANPGWRKSVSVSACGKTAENPPCIVQPADGPELWQLGVVGGGLVMVGVGATLNIVAARQEVDIYNKYLDQRFAGGETYDPKGYDREFDEQVKPKLISAYLLYGVGAAVAVSGTILLLLDTQTLAGRADGGACLFPVAGPEGVGIGLNLGF